MPNSPFEDLATDLGVRSKPRSTNHVIIITLAMLGIGAVVALTAAATVFFVFLAPPSQNVAKTIVQLNKDQKTKPIPVVPALKLPTQPKSPTPKDNEVKNPEPTPEPSKPAEKPTEPTAQELCEKGRGLCRTREYSLAEATFTKALLQCGDTKEQQLLKAELYLRMAVVKETVEANKRYDPFRPAGGAVKKEDFKPRWYDMESRGHARKIMTRQGMNSQEIQRKTNEITQDHRALLLDAVKKKNG